MSTQANQPLPEGTQLQNYRILRVLAAGGFSFVYLAHDAQERPVAIKEYLPATLALRVNGAAHPQVAEEDLRAGDLVCYDGHIAFWLGGGRILHSTQRDGADGVVEEREPTELRPRFRKYVRL